MSIEEGFRAMHKALHGAEPGQIPPSGHCDRCKAPLIIGPTTDCNAQPINTYLFQACDDGRMHAIYNGRPPYTFKWTATLCDRCCCDLHNWLLGQKLSPFGHTIKCNQFCDGDWEVVSINTNGVFVYQCNKCGHRQTGGCR